MIPKRVVIDTNVCLDLFVFLDPRWNKLLNGLETGAIQAICRNDCRDEWLAVLRYPHLPVTPENQQQVTSRFDQLIIIEEPETKSHQRLPICTDKDDQKFLEIARDSSAEVLITKDKALLKLARKLQNLGYFRIETPDKFVAQL